MKHEDRFAAVDRRLPQGAVNPPRDWAVLGARIRQAAMVAAAIHLARGSDDEAQDRRDPRCAE